MAEPHHSLGTIAAETEQRPPPPQPSPPRWSRFRGSSFGIAVVIYGLLVLILFWPPLVTDTGVVQWDALDVHLYNLRAVSESWRAGELPYWTRFIFGGFPLMADPQVSLWYPPNLLLVSWKITSNTILLQLGAHYLVAAVGAFLLFRRLSGNVPLSLGLGAVFAFGGFMVGHASHVGMQNTASWLPLLLWLLLLTVERRSLRLAAVLGLGIGMCILAGHLQVALYSVTFLVAYGLYALLKQALATEANEKELLRTGALLVMSLLVGVGLGAIQLLPAYELAIVSQRAELPLEVAEVQSLEPGSLPALVDYDYNGVALGPYTGPFDRTQNYLFLGPLTLLLAATGAVRGLRARSDRANTVFLLLAGLTAFLFALGPAGGLHELAYELLPLYDKVRAPIHILFILNLCLLMLAARSFSSSDFSRLPRALVWSVPVFLALPVVAVASQTELLYARAPDGIGAETGVTRHISQDFAATRPEQAFRTYDIPGFRLNASLLREVPSFDGYNPLSLQRFEDFVAAMHRNPHLVDVAGIKYLPCGEPFGAQGSALVDGEGTCVNQDYFGPATVIDSFVLASSPAEALALTSVVDLREVVVLEEQPVFLGEPSSASETSVEIIEQQGDSQLIAVSVPEEGFLFLNQTHYEGWTVTVDGEPGEVLNGNYLFQAVALAPGEHLVELQLRSKAASAGALVSGLALVVVAVALIATTVTVPSVPSLRRRLSPDDETTSDTASRT